MSEVAEIVENAKQNNHECPHCKFLYETFLKDSDSYTGERDYYLMTEVFVYLHGGDECTYFKNDNKCLKSLEENDKEGERDKANMDIRMYDKELLESFAFPPAPFLLTSIMKKGDITHFVVDSYEGTEIEQEGECMVQTIRWVAHKASKEELEEFLRLEEEEDGIYTGDIAPGHGGQGDERH